jgi:glycosyltransferase involved in cell wall biosynthesis
LAQWYAHREDRARALDRLIVVRESLAALGVAPTHDLVRCSEILHLDTLLHLGHVEEAGAAVEHALRLEPTSERLMLQANVTLARRDAGGKAGTADAERLAGINTIFHRTGLTVLSCADPSRPLGLNNLLAAAPSASGGLPRLSVLMPAYNAEATIATAIGSILRQSVPDLELIVVDDASKDGTWGTVQRLAGRDPRVKTIRQDVNRGAYVARNTALSHATGDFVTVHDADDWSHPQKLELQLRQMLAGQTVTVTDAVRVTSELEFRADAQGRQLIVNTSSAMFSRAALLASGGWDDVRMAADTELLERMLGRLDLNRYRVSPGAPLTFVLTHPRSLTSNPSTGTTSRHLGARREYSEAYRCWHKRERAKPAPNLVVGGARPFPVPNLLLSDRQERLSYDILYVADGTFPGGSTQNLLSMWHAGAVLGLRQAFFHWPRPNRVRQPIKVPLRQAIHDRLVEVIVSGEAVDCDLVVVPRSAALRDVPSRLPRFTSRSCILVADLSPATNVAPQRDEIDGVLGAARRLFGCEPVVAPGSSKARSHLACGSWTLTDQNWLPFIPLNQFAPPEMHHRPRGPRPVAGRHGRDEPENWPGEAEALAAAYCALQDVDVRILGGAEHAKLLLGWLPTNWTVLDYDALDATSFLHGLDVYLYYPAESQTDGPGRGVLEAMAAGVPVITRPYFTSTLHEAAVYAEPAEVLAAIMALCNDRARYFAQVKAGRALVEREYNSAIFADCVASYVKVLDQRGR